MRVDSHAEMPARRPTIRDVAAVAGVSYGTVSRFLNARKWVSPASASTIEAAIEATGYTANQQARSLATGRVGSIAFLVTGPHHHLFSDPTLSQLVEGASDRAMQRGQTLVMLLVNTAEERRHAIAYVRARHVDGVVMVSRQEGDELLGALVDGQVPVVTAGRPLGLEKKVPFVEVTEIDSAMAMTRHLKDRGYRRIALIHGPLAAPGGRLRKVGFEKEMGDSLKPSLVAESNFDSEDGYRVALRLLTTKPRPDAIFAASDVIAVGVLRAADELGLAVPGDVAIAGFDGSISMKSVGSGGRGRELTTVCQPWEQISHVVVDLLLSVIESGIAEPVVLEGSLRIGTTT